MISDLKLALRLLAKTPGFTFIAVLTLALGIGANSAIFSVIDAVLLRPLPFPKPNELVAVWSKVTNESERETDSYLDYADLRDQSQTLDSLTAYTPAATVLGTGTDSHEMTGAAITSDVFRVLRVQPFLGRAFTREEDNSDSRVVVLSYDAWKRYFNADPGVIGRQVLLSLRSYTVIGVMPAGFKFPVGRYNEYLQPLAPLVPSEIKNRASHFLRLVGRLKPGVTAQQANAELAGIASRLQQQYPDTNKGRSNYAISLHEDLTGDVRLALLTLVAAVAVVLLIACANVANLLLARATARRREIAIRTALGARRLQIVRQLLAEGLLLALTGGATGLLLAGWGVDLLRLFGPGDVPRLDQVGINSSVIAFTILATLVSTLLFALVPALQLSRPSVSEALQEGNRGGASPESKRLRQLLVVSQVALSMLLLAGAALLIKSFQNLRTTNPGFEPSRVLTVDTVLPRATYSDPQKQRQFFDQLLPKVEALPGIEAAGGAMPLPFSGNDRASSFWISGRPDPGQGNHPDASHLVVIGDYFRAMRIPLLAGRNFSLRDTATSPTVVIVNEEFAHKFFRDQNPIGQRIVIDRDAPKPPACEIVGVVASTRHESLAIAPIPEFYVPAAQEPGRRIFLVLRTKKTAGVDAAVRRSIHEVDPDIYVPAIQPLDNLIGTTLAQPRFHMALLGCFAGVALVLSAIGIYGVIAYTVAQRTREIGIRMALGAQRTDMLRMILRQSFAIVAVGLAAGLLGSLATTRLLKSLLYGVSAQDISIYALVLVVLSAAALIASYIPARRAMKVDPMVALRYE
jgi:putative ABC transport system permease protein